MARLEDFTLIYEFPCGTIKTFEGLWPTAYGLRLGPNRPYYTTLVCNVNQTDFTDEMLHIAKSIAFRESVQALSPGAIRGRILLKPAWFHKLITTRN